MKDAVYKYICDHPNCRKREIASEFHVWVCNRNLGEAIYDLLDERKIEAKQNNDHANLEYYLTYSKIS